MQLRTLAGGAEQLEVPGENLRQIIAGLDAVYPGMSARLLRDGALSPGLAVSIDGAFTSRGLLGKVRPDSEIHILPAIGGG